MLLDAEVCGKWNSWGTNRIFTNQWFKDFQNHPKRCFCCYRNSSWCLTWSVPQVPTSPSTLFANQLLKIWPVIPAKFGLTATGLSISNWWWARTVPGNVGFLGQGIQLNQKGTHSTAQGCITGKCGLPASQRRKGPVPSECQLYWWRNADGNKVLIFKCLLISNSQEQS